MDAIETLTAEHRQIERTLTALEIYAATLRAPEASPASLVVGDDPPRAELAAFVDFLRGYADGHHHGKEEDLLFAELVEAGFSRDFGPVGVMLGEHAQGRALVSELGAIGASSGPWSGAERQRVGEAAAAYAALLRAHIMKEDRILYPLALQHLPAARLAALGAAFDEHATVNAAAERRLTDLAERLVARWTPGGAPRAADDDVEPYAHGCGCCGAVPTGC